MLPYAVKGISRPVPALATGAGSALREPGINKLFGKGIFIPKKYIPVLPPFAKEFTKAKRDQSTKLIKPVGIGYQTNRKRWNKTMKNRMWKMFAVKNNTVYWGEIDKLVDDYNETSKKKNEKKSLV